MRVQRIAGVIVLIVVMALPSCSPSGVTGKAGV